MDKPYKLGILVGRFQTIHAGHEKMVNTALQLCEQVGIFVGSSQEALTSKNPFSYEIREEMLHARLATAGGDGKAPAVFHEPFRCRAVFR